MHVCDTHSDTLYEVGYKKNISPDITFERARRGGVTIQVMALWTGPQGNAGDYKGIVAAELSGLEVLKAQGFKQIDDPKDAREGETAILLSVEGGEVFQGGIETVAQFRKKGVRIAGITWNHDNDLGHPAKGGSQEGLTPYGLDIVKEMQRLKISVDVSHLNERGFYDIFQKTNVPPMASHSCVAKLRPHFRNLTDDQLRLLIREGGYVGINFYGEFLAEGGSTYETVLDHVDYICQMGGEKIVGFGSDFDGIDVYPDGLRHPGDLPHLISGMRRRGYSEAVIEGIAGLNLIDYFTRI